MHLIVEPASHPLCAGAGGLHFVCPEPESQVTTSYDLRELHRRLRTEDLDVHGSVFHANLPFGSVRYLKPQMIRAPGRRVLHLL